MNAFNSNGETKKRILGVGDFTAGLDDIVSRSRAMLVQAMAASLFLLGVAVMAGWVFRIPALTQVLPGFTSMVFNTALCFSICALVLTLNRSMRIGVRAVMAILGVGVLLLAVINLTQIYLNVSVGINLPELHRWIRDGNRNPGQMSWATSLCFLLAGANIVLLASQVLRPAPWSRRLSAILSGLLFLLGASAFIGYVLSLELLYTWYAFSRMALHTSLGMVVLSMALSQAWLLHDSGLQSSDAADRIARAATRTLVLVAVLATVVGIGAVKQQGNLALEQGLNASLVARRELISTLLNLRSERAAIITSRPSVIKQVRQLAIGPADAALRDAVTTNLSTFLPFGFSYIGLTAPDGKPLLQIGRKADAPTLEAAVRTAAAADAVLAWSDGFILRNRGPIAGADGIRGWIETEQPLPALSSALHATTTDGIAGEMELCTLQSGAIWCFPNSENSSIYVARRMEQNGALAIEDATAGGSGVGQYRNHRGTLTAAAYGPVGTTGLISTMSVDAATFFDPVKRSLIKGGALVALITLLGALALLSRIRPLARQLARSEQRHRSVLDALQEGVVLQDGDNQIISCNPAAEALLGLHVDELKGRTYLNPHWNAVREDGTPYAAEDFPPAQTFKRGVQQNNVVMGIEVGNEQRRWLSVSTSPVDFDDESLGKGVVASFVDITARFNAEKALAESNHLREAILEAAPYSIIATTQEGVITNVNAAAERMLWYRREELIGKLTPAVLHDSGEVVNRALELSKKYQRTIEPGFEVFVHEARSGIVEEREWTYIRKDGSRFPVCLAVTALRNVNGAVTGFLGIAYDISERKRREEYTQHIAHHDHLTGLPNRALLYDRMAQAIQRAERAKTKVGVLLIDLDHFKRVNDSLGHHVGDQLLQAVSERILSCVRGSDTVARMGGDEFVVILADIAEEGVAENIARKIVQAIALPVSAGGHELTVTPSVGVSIYPEDGDETQLLLKNSDSAMYWAKSSGRHGYQRFNREMERVAGEKMQVEIDLRRAIRNDELTVFYQPQISIGDGTIVGVEALLRWNDPVRGWVMPDQFIGIAEDTGLIIQIGERVLRRACSDALSLERKVGRKVTVAVNLSAWQFRDEGLPQMIQAVLQETALPPACLELEITESMLMHNQDAAKEQLHALRRLGVSVAVDDFGTGYSSLSYLTQFPISTLKIDRSFVGRMVGSRSDAAVVQAIAAIAFSLNLKVVAEGVETAEQLQFLRGRIAGLGSDGGAPGVVVDDRLYAQGYLMTEALPLERLEKEFSRLQARGHALIQSAPS